HALQLLHGISMARIALHPGLVFCSGLVFDGFVMKAHEPIQRRVGHWIRVAVAALRLRALLRSVSHSGRPPCAVSEVLIDETRHAPDFQKILRGNRPGPVFLRRLLERPAGSAIYPRSSRESASWQWPMTSFASL